MPAARVWMLIAGGLCGCQALAERHYPEPVPAQPRVRMPMAPVMQPGIAPVPSEEPDPPVNPPPPPIQQPPPQVDPPEIDPPLTTNMQHRPQMPPATPDGRPADWPVAQGFAGEAPESFVPYRCQSDERGNWVCLLRAGAVLNPGPCAFTPEGDLIVATQLVWTIDEASALLTRFGAAGEPVWSRVWNRSGGPPTHTIAAAGVGVHEDGRVVWAGTDCIQDEAAPLALDPDYYKGSCINGHVATLDAAGELLWELRVGAREGADRVTDLLLAPDGGVYVGGGFQAPLAVAGIDPLAAIGGVDHFVLALDREGRARWAHAFGSSEHEGDGVQLSASSQGGVAVRGNFTQSPTDGFVASLDADGVLHWQRDAMPHSLGHMVLVDDELLIAAGDRLLVLDAQGQLGARGLLSARGTPALGGGVRLETTDVGTLAFFTPALGLVEATPDGGVLRTLELGDWNQPYYYGGLCTGPDGAIAVTGSVREPTDFGFLDQPLQDVDGALYVLHLADWQDQDGAAE